MSNKTQDIGYGSIENGKGKAASFEKAKKEAATDGLKRSLRTFGNVLGNCLYDKEYLKKVQSMKVRPIKFLEDNLYRHPDFAPPPQEEQALVKPELQRTPSRPNQILRTRTEHLTHSTTAESADFDDEFDGNLFDGVEVSEDHGENTFDSASSDTVGPRAIEAPGLGNGTNGTNSGRDTPGPVNGHPQPQRQAAPMGRGQGPPQQCQPNQGPGRPQPNGANQRGPQTPQQPRPDQTRRMPPPTNDVHKAPMPQQQNGQQPQQQPLRPTPPQAQQANQPRPAPQSAGNAGPQNNGPAPNVSAQVGFASARAAEQIQTANSAIPLNSVAFNPHAESPVPKEKRTPGLDHTRSVPVKRKDDGNAPVPPPQGLARPANGSAAGFNRPSNFVNPQQDTNRRIGMPGGGANYAMSPSANRGAYKPLSINNPAANALKRERGALQDVTNAGPNGAATEGGDAKRQRVEVPGAENAGVTSS